MARQDAPTAQRALRRAVAAAADQRDPAGTAQAVLDALLATLPGDAVGALMLMHPQTGLFWSGAVTGLPTETCHPFFDLELSDEPDSLRRMAATGAPARALRGRGGRSRFLVEVGEPAGFRDELRAVFPAGGMAWGGVSLWRRDGEFHSDDEALLEAVAGEIGLVLRRVVLEALENGSDARVPRGMLLVEEGRVVGSGLDGLAIGQELEDATFEQYRHVDHLLALAATDPRFSTVIRTADGNWLSAHGTTLADGRTAIMLGQASPADLFGARVAGAGLTDREIEVTRLLCRGLSDGEIATELCLSPHTVHDHVRSVRRKLGVRSRAAVAARVFNDAYFDVFLASAAIRHGG